VRDDLLTLWITIFESDSRRTWLKFGMAHLCPIDRARDDERTHTFVKSDCTLFTDRRRGRYNINVCTPTHAHLYITNYTYPLVLSDSQIRVQRECNVCGRVRNWTSTLYHSGRQWKTDRGVEKIKRFGCLRKARKTVFVSFLVEEKK
jgi:hypothetical protein